LSRLRREPYFIAITLRDGRKVGGAFLGQAFASNYPYKHDLLIDQVWSIDQTNGAFTKLVEGQAGLYISGKDIFDT
jgi:hypothetical protein